MKTQYPCANTCCPDKAWVNKPGAYCNHPDCQREKSVQEAVDEILNDNKDKQLAKQRYFRHKERRDE